MVVGLCQRGIHFEFVGKYVHCALCMYARTVRTVAFQNLVYGTSA